MESFKRTLGYLMTFLFLGIIVFAVLVYTRVIINPFTKVLETDMILSKDIVELGVRDMENIDVTFVPANATYRDIIWQSKNPSVAEVINGVIIARSSGETEVTATSHENITKTIIVKVNIIPVKSLNLSKKNTTITIGDTLILRATVKPTDASYKDVTWTSSNESVATVENGRVKGKATGTTTITARTSNGITASCVVKVVKKSTVVTSVKLNQTTAVGDIGETINLKATIYPSSAINKNITWTSSDENVATVDADGMVSLLSNGSATIYAKSNNGKTAKCTITVGAKEILATNISLNQSNTNINVGDALNLVATINPSNAINKNITWTSSNESVATVDNGKVAGIKAGTAIIIAKTSNGKSASATINVVSKAVEVTGIALSKTQVSMNAGEKAVLSATISPSNATNKNITWTSSNERVATVDSNGNVTALNGGTTTITVKSSNGKSAICTVTVSNKVVEVTSISINKTSASINVDGTVQLSASVNPSNASDKSITWISSDTSVATVNNTGIVTGRKAGTTTITAKSSNGKTAICTVTVIAKPTPITSNLEIHFIATGFYDDGILIRTKNHAIFIDGGRGGEQVVSYLKTVGVKKLDYIIGSHAEDDHIHAEADVIRNFEVGSALYSVDITTCNSPCRKDDDGVKAVKQALKEVGKTAVTQPVPSVLKVGDMTLYFIAPSKEHKVYNINDSSFIFILKYGNNTFMFPGDSYEPFTNGVETMINNAKSLGLSNIKVDMLKYPHHGNSPMYDKTFNEINPSIVVVPNYKAPSFPKDYMKTFLNNHGVTTYRQSDSSTGNIVLVSNGKTINVKMNANPSDYAW